MTQLSLNRLPTAVEAGRTDDYMNRKERQKSTKGLVWPQYLAEPQHVEGYNEINYLVASASLASARTIPNIMNTFGNQAYPLKLSNARLQKGVEEQPGTLSRENVIDNLYLLSRIQRDTPDGLCVDLYLKCL